MAWQIIAIWLITGVTLVLFHRSEAQRHDRALAIRARAFALDPVYRHRTPAYEAPAPDPAPAGLSPADRHYLRTIARRGLVRR